MLDILANSPRRHLLSHLQTQANETSSVEEATKHILTELAKEQGKQPNHDDVQINLQHQYIPKLVDAGVIEFDVRSQKIRYRPNQRLEELHDRVREFKLE